jgi:hypothetical protein
MNLLLGVGSRIAGGGPRLLDRALFDLQQSAICFQIVIQRLISHVSPLAVNASGIDSAPN